MAKYILTYLRNVFFIIFCFQYRCNWYQIMSSLEDNEEAQLKGFCDVVYCPGNILRDVPSSFNRFSKVARRNGKMLEGLPARISTFHFCYDDPRVKFVITALGNSFGKQIRLRIRTHYGMFMFVFWNTFLFCLFIDISV